MSTLGSLIALYLALSFAILAAEIVHRYSFRLQDSIQLSFYLPEPQAIVCMHVVS